MSWKHTYNLRGKPVISKDKPGEQIEKVLDEIQAKAITAILGTDSYEEGNESPVAIIITRTGGTVTIRGYVSIPGADDILPNDATIGQSLIWDGNKWIAGWPSIHE